MTDPDRLAAIVARRAAITEYDVEILRESFSVPVGTAERFIEAIHDLDTLLAEVRQLRVTVDVAKGSLKAQEARIADLLACAARKEEEQ